MEMGGSDPQSKYSTGQLLEMCHRTALIDRPMGYFSNGSNGNQLARSGDCKQPAVLQGDEPIRTVLCGSGNRTRTFNPMESLFPFGRFENSYR